jgi:hypothetical protein
MSADASPGGFRRPATWGTWPSRSGLPARSEPGPPRTAGKTRSTGERKEVHPAVEIAWAPPRYAKIRIRPVETSRKTGQASHRVVQRTFRRVPPSDRGEQGGTKVARLVLRGHGLPHPCVVPVSRIVGRPRGAGRRRAVCDADLRKAGTRRAMVVALRSPDRGCRRAVSRLCHTPGLHGADGAVRASGSGRGGFRCPRFAGLSAISSRNSTGVADRPGCGHHLAQGGRSEPGKFSRYVQALASRIHPPCACRDWTDVPRLP